MYTPLQVIFWRHAEAEDASSADGADADLRRELTRQGRRDASRMAAWIKAHVPKPWTVRASPARRTMQTANALVDDPYTESLLAPGGSVDDVLRVIEHHRGQPSALVLCGHQPTLGAAALRWISGAEGDFSVRKGAVLWVMERQREGAGARVLRACVSPDLLE